MLCRRRTILIAHIAASVAALLAFAGCVAPPKKKDIRSRAAVMFQALPSVSAEKGLLDESF